jgi:catechol 2,3-dioxygenase-like lactoylglutathione lyase family enzyme
MVKALAHICFIVRDLDKSIAFYRDRLGLSPAFDFLNDKGERFGVYLHVGGRNFVELFRGAPARGSTPVSFQHFCLEVDDIRAAVRKLRKSGVEVSPVTMGCDHTLQAWLSDPDGNRIELHAYTPRSRQAPWVRPCRRRRQPRRGSGG